jgi:hypothetical protein
MKLEKEKNWTKRPWKNTVNKKSTKKDWTTKVVTDKNQTTNPETNVSVFTKTTNPKVIIKTESLENNYLCKIHDKHKVLRFLCFVIICIIILATFFLSLHTYNTVNELAKYIML